MALNNNEMEGRLMNRRTRYITSMAITALSLAALAGCSADEPANDGTDAVEFPQGDITIIVPYAAGGASDLSARTLASEMESTLGVSVIVENRTGGAGSVGLSYLAGSAPDGYTLGYMPVETAMLGSQGYDIDPADYEWIGQIMIGPASIAVPADSPYETLEDLVQAAKENPGQISVANSGAGSIWFAVTTALGEISGVEFNPVPFDGGAPAVAAAIGEQVDAVVAGISETSIAHKDGQLRVLAVVTEERADALPDVPTAIEEGFDLTMGGWGAIGAPAGLPADVLAVLENAVDVGVNSQSYTEVISTAGNIPFFRSSSETAEFVGAETERFAGIFADAE